jgi:hypothetical protein
MKIVAARARAWSVLETASGTPADGREIGDSYIEKSWDRSSRRRRPIATACW